MMLVSFRVRVILHAIMPNRSFKNIIDQSGKACRRAWRQCDSIVRGNDISSTRIGHVGSLAVVAAPVHWSFAKSPSGTWDSPLERGSCLRLLRLCVSDVRVVRKSLRVIHSRCSVLPIQECNRRAAEQAAALSYSMIIFLDVMFGCASEDMVELTNSGAPLRI